MHPNLHWPAHHHLHWGSRHLHWPAHLHLHGSSHHLNRPAGAYVGRIGGLAVALGIGTATAAGFCAACAYADTGDSTSSSAGPAAPSTSQSVASVARKQSRVASTPGRMAAAQTAATIASASPSSALTAANALTNLVTSLSDAAAGGVVSARTETAVAASAASARAARGGSAAAPVVAAAKAATSSASPTTSVQAESMVLTRSTGGRVVTDRAASGGSALVLTSNVTASTTVVLPNSTALVVRAKATLNSGSPNMTLAIDGVPVTTVVISGTSWADYTFTGVIPAGTHVLSVSTSNSNTKRSLYIDALSVTTGPFIEDFVGSAKSAPSAANWTIKTGSGWDPGVENYQTGNVTLDGRGNLVIQAAKTRTGYTSGWAETKNKISFGYGTITARIKVPAGQGLWPAFWLKGANEDTVPWPQSGEIDILELPSTTTTIYSTLRGPINGSTATQQGQVVSNVPDLSAGYHNFWVRHLPNEITFGVDGTTLGTLTPASLAPGSQWVYNQPMFAILNLAVGGPWAGAPTSSTRFPASMTVDWVRWDPPSVV